MVLELFGLIPDYDLNIMKPNQSISMITANVLLGLEEVFQKEKPDIVLVHGDTTTTFAAALAAFYHQISIGHVEAGLRTYDKYSPYPEEMNRVMTGHLADLHFSPTKRNRENLLREGIKEERIFITGNTVIDALLEIADKPYQFEDKTLAGIDFEHKRVITVTCHRRENLGENMEHIFSAVRRIGDEFDDVEIIYPVHLNPKVRGNSGQNLSRRRQYSSDRAASVSAFCQFAGKILSDYYGFRRDAGRGSIAWKASTGGAKRNRKTRGSGGRHC